MLINYFCPPSQQSCGRRILDYPSSVHLSVRLEYHSHMIFPCNKRWGTLSFTRMQFFSCCCRALLSAWDPIFAPQLRHASSAKAYSLEVKCGIFNLLHLWVHWKPNQSHGLLKGSPALVSKTTTPDSIFNVWVYSNMPSGEGVITCWLPLDSPLTLVWFSVYA